MKTAILLQRLADNGIQIEAQGSDLRLRGPREVLTPTILRVVSEHKVDLLEELRDESTQLNPQLRPEGQAGWSDEARHIYETRLGIATDHPHQTTPEAHELARREATAVNIGLPPHLGHTLLGDVLDAFAEDALVLKSLTPVGQPIPADLDREIGDPSTLRDDLREVWRTTFIQNIRSGSTRRESQGGAWEAVNEHD
ncbi:MAG: hypothetical protein OER86_03585 [Phycisphaerae bacterium]|nr:hypothetical protein [Phycisphaerae bacterium]